MILQIAIVRIINPCYEIFLFDRKKNILFLQNASSSSKLIFINKVIQRKLQILAIMTMAHDSQLI